MPKLQINKFCFALSLLVLSTGCEEDPENRVISQFDRPQDVAFICYDDNEKTSLSIICCNKDVQYDSNKDVQYDECTSAVDAKLYAFVTQTTPGEVAVVDVEERRIVDQDDRIPYNSFIPVGGQPNDIAATDDGKRVYTTNFETGDVSVIHVTYEVTDKKTGKKESRSVIDTPFLAPAASIDLGGMAARMALVKFPEQYKDRFAIVTQPYIGRLAVLALMSDDCPTPQASPNGCVLAHLPLSTISAETGQAENQPWAITHSEGQSIYVGSYNGAVIWDIQTETLIVEAKKASRTTQVISLETVRNDTIPIPYRGVRALSLEPESQNWLYAIENDEAGVFAIDLKKREKGKKEQPDIIHPVNVSGKARAVKLVEFNEGGDPGPFTFNGTFAIISTTLAGFAVIDVEDTNKDPIFPHKHEIRSAVDLTSDAGTPKIEEELMLTVDGEEISSGNMDKYMYLDPIEDQDAGCDAGTTYRKEYDYGVRIKCDPRATKEESWTLAWEATIGISGVGTITNINDEERGEDPYILLSEDWDKDFCKEELYTKGSEAYLKGTPEDYPGDILIITSEPTPDEGAEEQCKNRFEKEELELAFRVVGVTRDDLDDIEDPVNKILFVPLDETVPELDPKCFGQALEYEIRVDDHWVLRGSRSSFTRTELGFDKDTKSCRYDKDEDEPSKMRVFPGQKVDNDRIAFTMKYGDEWADAGPSKIEENLDDDEDPEEDPEVNLKFNIVGGYQEMYALAVGNNITDIEFTPDNQLTMVDQAGEGLIIFDMLNGFSKVGLPIN